MMARIIYVVAVAIPAAIPNLAGKLGVPWLAAALPNGGWYWLALVIALGGLLWEIASKGVALEDKAANARQISIEGIERIGAWFYLNIKGNGGYISDGLVKVTEIENDPNTSHLPMALRTKAQREGNRTGRFNISAKEPKKVPFLKVNGMYDSTPETVQIAYEEDIHSSLITDQNERIFHISAFGGDYPGEAKVKLSFDEQGKAHAEIIERA